MTDYDAQLATVLAENHNLRVELNALSLLLCRLAEKNGGILRFTQIDLTNAEIFTLYRDEDPETGDVLYKAEKVYNITELESAE